MLEPRASRPYMPGYGTLPAGQGSGLLPWSWALKRLRDSHDYWLSTVWPDGRPHLTPVWAVWRDDAIWFSSAFNARKIRNIRAGSGVSIATDDPLNPVVVEGTARVMKDSVSLRAFLAAMNEKYRTGYGLEFLDPARNATVRIRPTWAFGLVEGDFPGSPTRWEFR
ncbi:MAG TPA: pyridoxamine 5'-phosphate oxidase family protein [Amycolatopsis sp.]|uniref:pyridoxamine 5'-phosphate oxidase family protein n=1 Tax=Amycolatopsis sp. TaxID=37632 RepID=UPI002B4800F8|nr:pyridoxamine 5'-phosphate oxidase family protein [Amycolatopsis sp.]HKS47576.1 pyridoxamine 5'-phosphate oxidase family protein [Amycolatopsis sp.]